MWHLNFTNCFGGEHFALDPNNGLQTFSSPIFLSYYTQTRMSPAKKNLGSLKFATHALMISLGTQLNSAKQFCTLQTR